MASNKNAIVHYGGPAISSLLGTLAVGGFILAAGGEEFRRAHWQAISMNAIYLATIFFLIWMVADARRDRFKLPRVKMLIDGDAILVCEWQDWLGLNSSVAIYRKDSDYERPLASGFVSNVQSNGLVQVQLVEPFSGVPLAEFAKGLVTIQLQDFIVKPGQDWRRA